MALRWVPYPAIEGFSPSLCSPLLSERAQRGYEVQQTGFNWLSSGTSSMRNSRIDRIQAVHQYYGTPSNTQNVRLRMRRGYLPSFRQHLR